ncbi:tetratricopeptide repeat protein [Micromonospora sp. NPDC049559]|uniref:tetratricopeptide repeat protein n=1 Tax=Micromonospora sp. NPDC049559 TaxID=3155923 RepID=UPI0034224105
MTSPAGTGSTADTSTAGSAADTGTTVLARALSLARVGRLDAAESMVRAVLAEQPRNPHALQVLAFCHQQADRYAEMLAAATEAAAVLPEDAGAHRLRARALVGLGRGPEAREAAERARALDPEDPWSELVLAQALLVTGGTAAAHGAAAAVRRARSLGTDTVEVYLVEALIWRRMAEFGRARAAYEQALRVDPGNVDALRQLAVLDSDRGRPVRASRAFSGTLAAAPADPGTVESARVGARRALWLLTDVACLPVWLAVALANVPSGSLPGPVGVVAAQAVVLAGTAAAVGYLRWRVRRLGAGTRTMLRTHRWRPVFALAWLRVAAIALGGLLLPLDPGPDRDPSVLRGVAIALVAAPMVLVLLRARNSLLRELVLLVRRLWFRLTTPAEGR